MKCSKCEEEKHIKNFNWRNKKNKIRHNLCGACRKVYSDYWYAKHGDKHREKQKARNKKYRAISSKFHLDYLKTHQCVDCGNSDPVVLEFDHVRGTKVANISVLKTGWNTLSKLKKEIDKCEVVCANCHRIRTAKTQGWFKKYNQ